MVAIQVLLSMCRRGVGKKGRRRLEEARRPVGGEDRLRWSCEACCAAGPAVEGRDAPGPRDPWLAEPASRPRGTDRRPMTPTGLAQWHPITQTGAVSGAVAKGRR